MARVLQSNNVIGSYRYESTGFGPVKINISVSDDTGTQTIICLLCHNDSDEAD